MWNIKCDLGALRKTTWWEVAIRFAFGGAITVVAGLLAKNFGPVLGGLFLAFPAIFPASATLVEKHEREKKLKAGIARTLRGREAAAVDAKGAALGALGLCCFAAVVWQVLPRWSPALALAAAVAAWFAIAVLAWRADKRLRRR